METKRCQNVTCSWRCLSAPEESDFLKNFDVLQLMEMVVLCAIDDYNQIFHTRIFYLVYRYVKEKKTKNLPQLIFFLRKLYSDQNMVYLGNPG